MVWKMSEYYFRGIVPVVDILKVTKIAQNLFSYDAAGKYYKHFLLQLCALQRRTIFKKFTILSKIVDFTIFCAKNEVP